MASKKETGKSKLTTIDLVGGILCNICQAVHPTKKEYEDHYVTHSKSPDKILYSCVVCNNEFISYPNLRSHCYTRHILKGRFRCNVCCKEFSKAAALTEHENNMHIFKCNTCDKEFDTKKELQMHRRMHKETGPPFPCTSCEDPIPNIEEGEHHVEIHALFTYICPICNKEFCEKLPTAKHLTEHFEGETVSDGDMLEVLPDTSASTTLGGILCYICGDTYHMKSEFDQHFEDEHDDEESFYSCNVCGNQFEGYLAYNNHCYNHIMKEKFRCDNCNKIFHRLYLLVNHVALCKKHQHQGPGVERPFACNHCTSRFADENRLKNHLKTVHNTDKFQCMEPMCGLIFPALKDLVMHRFVHKKTNKYCHQCGLEFATIVKCEEHLDIHRRIEFSCPICDKKFTEKYLIIKHVAHHFESVFHVCKLCGKVYNIRSRLVEHMKTHTEEKKSFKCDVCGKGFCRQEIFKQHMNTHTGEKPFKCPNCEKAFSCYPNWFKHLKKIHNIDPKIFRKDVFKNLSIQKENIEVDTLSIITRSTEIDPGCLSPNMIEDALSFAETMESENNIDLDVLESKVSKVVNIPHFKSNLDRIELCSSKKPVADPQSDSDDDDDEDDDIENNMESINKNIQDALETMENDIHTSRGDINCVPSALNGIDHISTNLENYPSNGNYQSTRNNIPNVSMSMNHMQPNIVQTNLNNIQSSMQPTLSQSNLNNIPTSSNIKQNIIQANLTNIQTNYNNIQRNIQSNMNMQLSNSIQPMIMQSNLNNIQANVAIPHMWNGITHMGSIQNMANIIKPNMNVLDTGLDKNANMMYDQFELSGQQQIYQVQQQDNCNGNLTDLSYENINLQEIQPLRQLTNNYEQSYGTEYNCQDNTNHSMELDTIMSLDTGLTITQQSGLYDQNVSNLTYNVPQDELDSSKWEPLITKIQTNYAFDELPNIPSNVLSVLTTDIY